MLVMIVATNYLHNQNTFRDLYDYRHTLCLDYDMKLYADQSLLVIGGGTNIRDIARNTDARVTNVDLYIDDEIRKNSPKNLRHVQQDFNKTKFHPNSFNEIWALYSLPMYCTSVAAVEMFTSKSVYYLKPGGTLRIAPGLYGAATNIEDHMMKRDISQTELFNVFYHTLNYVKKIGGNVRVNVNSNMYNKNDVYAAGDDCNIPHKISKFPDYYAPHFELLANLDLYTAPHLKNTSCIEITKPESAAEKINQIMERRIATLDKITRNEKIIVRWVPHVEVTR